MSRRNRRSTLVLIFTILASPSWSLAEIIHVHDTASGEPHDGKDWRFAYLTLQEALDDADPGDEIWVAHGTYRPSQRVDPQKPRTATFTLVDDVKIYGGSNATGEALAVL